MQAPWDELSSRLRESSAFRELAGSGRAAARLPPPAAAWVAELVAADAGRPVVAIVPHEADALAWIEGCRLLGGEPAYFAPPNLSPYQETELSLSVRAAEAVALDRLLDGRARTLVATPRSLFRRLPSRRSFAASVLEIAAGDELPIEVLASHLDGHGYRRRDLVSELGEYAVRGGVLDLFPPGEPHPLRLDLFGDTIESIRRFDAVDQRSLEEVERLRVLPLALFPSGAAPARRLARTLVESGWASGGPAAERIEALETGGGYPGWENLLPLLAADAALLTELEPRALVVALDPPALAAEVAAHEERLAGDWRARREHRRVAPPPEAVEHPGERVAGALETAELVVEGSVGGGGDAVDFGGSVTDLFHHQLPRFPREVETAAARGERLLVVSPPEHAPRLERLCRTYELERGRGGVEVVSGELERGFRLPPAGVAIYGERQLFASVAVAPRARRPAHAAFVSGLRDLKIGDHVVHGDHGIGRFVALRTVGDEERSAALPPSVEGVRGEGPAAVEVMEIEYAGGRRLLMPLTRIDRVQKYGGIGGAAPQLDRLGGTSWNRTKTRVREGMRKMAIDLLRLYAERQVARAAAIPASSDLIDQFDAAFEHEPTADQAEAVRAIAEDMAGERPMDRLLCGDVGFGKTEVAMRAAFRTVAAGYQVAVLAPTTILADQHLETFRARFADFPVTVEVVSRFRRPAEIRAVRERVAAGQVDVLIGTHRLLSRDIELPKLGLLVVDEEQRFGVAQKERLKNLKKDVHVLALSATPVPRTLQLSMAGVRDLSVIETPPRDRLAVETAIVPFSGELLREAIEDELERGGQVYYVYNRVQGIEEMARYLRQLLPDLRLTIGHGQMDELELAHRMHAFKRGEYDLLVATTIIENGIDISNVNTMIVHRADRFGLAQLYQLRGRVGRGNRLAYCYLTVPSRRSLTEVARRRLGAIREFTELGAGFRVAARDLEIRGAGNLLGAEQSGHIAAVGMETYLKMLEETVRELRGEAVETAPSASISLPVAMHIPADYVADANLRMELYRRIAAGEETPEALVAELRDRFGPPPEPVLRLLETAELKRSAESLRVQSISARGRRLQLKLRRDARVDVERLIEMVSGRDGVSFSPTGVLTFEGVDPERMVALSRETLAEIAP